MHLFATLFAFLLPLRFTVVGSVMIVAGNATVVVSFALPAHVYTTTITHTVRILGSDCSCYDQHFCTYCTPATLLTQLCFASAVGVCGVHCGGVRLGHQEEVVKQ
jgi:hypothetical protein